MGWTPLSVQMVDETTLPLLPGGIKTFVRYQNLPLRTRVAGSDRFSHKQRSSAPRHAPAELAQQEAVPACPPPAFVRRRDAASGVRQPAAVEPLRHPFLLYHWRRSIKWTSPPCRAQSLPDS